MVFYSAGILPETRKKYFYTRFRVEKGTKTCDPRTEEMVPLKNQVGFSDTNVILDGKNKKHEILSSHGLARNFEDHLNRFGFDDVFQESVNHMSDRNFSTFWKDFAEMLLRTPYSPSRDSIMRDLGEVRARKGLPISEGDDSPRVTNWANDEDQGEQDFESPMFPNQPDPDNFIVDENGEIIVDWENLGLPNYL